MVRNLGGVSVWQALSDAERMEHEEQLLNDLCESLADEAYAQLDEDEKRRLKLWVWAGCGMHKDLNSVKGGDSAMQMKWKDIGSSPVPLANKDNAPVLDAAEEHGLAVEDGDEKQEENAVERCAREVTKAGGVKLVNLIGALLNHKDDKKGQQHTFRDYARYRWGRTFTFPDTSNTRYSSYLEAAAEVVAHLDHYVEYMRYVRDAKEKRTLNNLEANVLKGLQDTPTITELAVLALYQEAVSHPYILSIRGLGHEHTNTLDLAPLHKKVQTHIKKLISDPHILLSPDADPGQATLNGYDKWKNEEAVTAVHNLGLRLPHLNDLLKAFLSGALETWERFSSEFADDGTIAALTEAKRDLAWIPATNDANEGALGAYQIFAWKNPTGTLRFFNSIFRMKRNETHEFMDAKLSGTEHEAFLRREACTQEAMGLERKRRREICEENVETVAKKRRKDDQKREKKEERRRQLDSVKLEFDVAAVKKFTNKKIKDHLDKLRIIDEEILPDVRLKNKEERLDELLKALAKYKANERDEEE